MAGVDDWKTNIILREVIVLIKPANEMKVEERVNMRGGDGTVTIRHLFSGEELGANARLSAHITLPPGASIGSHAHEGERELFYIIKGEAVLTENGQDYLMKSGDSSLTGGGGFHAVANRKEEPLEMIALIIMG